MHDAEYEMNDGVKEMPHGTWPTIIAGCAQQMYARPADHVDIAVRDNAEASMSR